MKIRALTSILFASAANAATITVDARDVEPGWQQAEVVSDFRLTEPDSGAEPAFKTIARVWATPEGLAVYFQCDQDPAVYPKRAVRSARDGESGSDRVNVMFDFDGLGQAGYSLTLSRSDSIEDSTISNENIFNSDWDGVWYHAVRERDGGWDAEYLIPWTSALMRKANGERRTIALYLDRVIGAKSERAAAPNLAFGRPQFLSKFRKFEVPAYQQGLLRWYPYATVLSDLVSNTTEFRSGLDVFWKPSSSFQLTAAINPDFGQVEADNLVVNFDAVETFFSDKRPFFTENQSAFVRQSPEEEQLIYTRRVGGNRDDGQGISDIDVAAKMSGSAAGLDYGVFAVRERDPDVIGRSISAIRVNRPSDVLDIGYLGSYVERPFLDRYATVHAIDTEFDSAHWRFTATALQSQIKQQQHTQTGTGGFGGLTYKPNDNIDTRIDLTRYGKSLNYNDLGFQRRPDFALYEFTQRIRKNDFSEGSKLRTRNLGFEVDFANNSGGKHLYTVFQANMGLNFVDGSSTFVEVTRSLGRSDDLISRGNGVVDLNGGPEAYANYNWARRGKWQGEVAAYVTGDIGYNSANAYVGITANYFASDDLTIQAELGTSQLRDRLLWQSGTLFARYKKSQQIEPSFNVAWLPGQKHELRAKVQLLEVTAERATGLRLQPNGRLLATQNESIPNFAISSFGVQLRYRYKINQESDLFVVYSRGGEAFDNPTEPDAWQILGDAFELRDADQFLVKLRYAL